MWRGLQLSGDDVLRADLIQALMCQGEVRIGAFEDRHDIDFHEYFAESLAQLAPLQADGLVEVDAGRIAVTSRGRLLLRIIAMCFDRYLQPTTTPTTLPRFSRVI